MIYHPFFNYEGKNFHNFSMSQLQQSFKTVHISIDFAKPTPFFRFRSYSKTHCVHLFLTITVVAFVCSRQNVVFNFQYRFADRFLDGCSEN